MGSASPLCRIIHHLRFGNVAYNTTSSWQKRKPARGQKQLVVLAVNDVVSRGLLRYAAEFCFNELETEAAGIL